MQIKLKIILVHCTYVFLYLPVFKTTNTPEKRIVTAKTSSVGKK
jgi:hypothetical protein